jgi:hypothetical protein
MDLAALRLRNPAEPLGADLSQLFRHYATVTGEPIDVAALRFHTVVFALVGVMALAGPMVEPQAGSPHLEYLWWDLMQRRALVWALAECIGVSIDPPVLPTAMESALSPMLVMLSDSLAQLQPARGMDGYQQRATALLARCVARTNEVGPPLDRATAAEYAAILGLSADDLRALYPEMESFVVAAGPDSDIALVQCFARQVERMVFALEPVADRVVGYALAPVDL